MVIAMAANETLQLKSESGKKPHIVFYMSHTDEAQLPPPNNLGTITSATIFNFHF